MQKVVKFLEENPVQYMGTIGLDGRAKVRPFMFCFQQEGKLWFCTNNQKDVYREMQNNPWVELSVSSPAYAWLRLSGRAVFADDRAAKEGCMANPIVKSQYDSADNPIFQVFYLADAQAVLADFSGEPPKRYPVT